MSQMKTFIQKASQQFHSDLKDRVDAGIIQKDQANRIFKALFAQPICLEYLKTIGCTDPAQDRFHSFDWLTDDYTLDDALEKYTKVSDCRTLDKLHAIDLGVGTAYIIGAYQTHVRENGEDYEDTSDYAIIIEGRKSA